MPQNAKLARTIEQKTTGKRVSAIEIFLVKQIAHYLRFRSIVCYTFFFSNKIYITDLQ